MAKGKTSKMGRKKKNKLNSDMKFTKYSDIHNSVQRGFLKPSKTTTQKGSPYLSKRQINKQPTKDYERQANLDRHNNITNDNVH